MDDWGGPRLPANAEQGGSAADSELESWAHHESKSASTADDLQQTFAPSGSVPRRNAAWLLIAMVIGFVWLMQSCVAPPSGDERQAGAQATQEVVSRGLVNAASIGQQHVRGSR